jgi:hypothetical protein
VCCVSRPASPPLRCLSYLATQRPNNLPFNILLLLLLGPLLPCLCLLPGSLFYSSRELSKGFVLIVDTSRDPGPTQSNVIVVTAITALASPPAHTMYAPQPTMRRLSTQSNLSSHSSPQTSPPNTANGFAQHNLIPVPCRQLHPPKSPLYRPAVLRAIDHISRPNSASPSTSPKSMSVDLFDFKREMQYNDEFEDAIGDECEEEETGRVTGPPARNHWKVCWLYSLCFEAGSMVGLYA